MPSAAENHEINRIGNMPTFSISENNESLLSDCRAEKKYKKILFPVPDGGNAEGHLH